MSHKKFRILIIAEHASLKFGGEAALPLQYFRVLRDRGIETWLVVHERTREELEETFSNDIDRIYFIPDTFWHRLLWQLSRPLPRRISSITVGFLLALLTQLFQLQIAKRVIKEKKIDIVHQPIPVSPKQPSMLFNLGVPIVIGPMNGGMNYPPAFQYMESRWVQQMVGVGRFFSSFMNILIPGKRKATILLVANTRTKEALPKSVAHNTIIELVENGVDLSIWSSEKSPILSDESEINLRQGEKKSTRFVYIGRLVDWKAVDLLLIALKQVVEYIPVELEIIGDGVEKVNLEQQAIALGLISPQTVRFSGWLSQVDCAKRLQEANVLVLPSLYECGGAVVLEAMAVGLPVIATNWGGPTDYLNQDCGILVEPTSKQALIDGFAKAMIKMSENPELIQKMGQAGHQRVIKDFDWEKKGDEILKIYQKSVDLYSQS